MELKTHGDDSPPCVCGHTWLWHENEPHDACSIRICPCRHFTPPADDRVSRYDGYGR